MNIEVRHLEPADVDVLDDVAPDVFDHAIDPDMAREFLNDPRHHLVVALDASLVVGFVSAVHYIHPDKAPELWINEVGVAETHRRRGIAGDLLRSMLERGRKLGCAEAWVLTERENPNAMSLYASVGGAASDQVMFDFRTGNV